MDPSPRPLDWSTQLRAAFDAAPVGMALLDLDGTIMQANRALRGILGMAPVWPADAKLRDFLHPDDAAAADMHYWLLATGDLDSYRAEKRLQRSDGTTLWASISASVVCDGQGYPRFLTVHIQDVTEQKTVEARLRHRALHDPVTGLPNRTLFIDRLDEALAGARRRDEGLTVLLLGLDGFRTINDTLGRGAGDDVLREVSERLVNSLRERDLVARVGGDEFALLLERTRGAGAANIVAERILDVIRSPISAEQTAVSVSASIGIARADVGPLTAADLMHRAERALVQARTQGASSYVVFRYLTDELTFVEPPAPGPKLVRPPTPLRRS